MQPAEYIRLLGYPRGWVLEGRAQELAEWARDWYAQHGRPWVYAREADALRIDDDAVVIDGVPFTSPRLRSTLHDAGARLARCSSRSAPARNSKRKRRRAGATRKPDEYFFLEMFGSAVVEHLVTMTGARLCAWADGRTAPRCCRTTVPGYPEWEIDEQPSLLELIRAPSAATPCLLEVLESGMLRPKKSLLAVFGLTPHIDRVRRLTELVPCENCSFAPCQYPPRAVSPRAQVFRLAEMPVQRETKPSPLSAMRTTAST